MAPSGYTLSKVFFTGCFSLIAFFSSGRGFEKKIFAQDSIIKIHGYIYDSISQKPERITVQATIIFESLPHGNEVGIISSNDTSGYFEYHININKDYRVSVYSDNHRTYSELFDPQGALRGGQIEKDYYLMPEWKENQVIRLKNLIFELGKANITSNSYEELNRLVSFMSKNPSALIQLEGHTDYRGSKRLNMQLSQHRVDAVKKYLVGKGVNPKRIKTKAFGGTMPLVKEKSIEASEINRRVEVRILKL